MAESKRNIKIPPQAIEFEEAVLGALMIDKNAMAEVGDILSPESFYKDAHKEIFKALETLFQNAEPIDVLTVKEQLQQNKKLKNEFAIPFPYSDNNRNRTAYGIRS